MVLGTVAAATAGDGAALTPGNRSALFLREPFNMDCTRPCGKTNMTEVKDLRKGFVGHFPWIGEAEEEEGTLAAGGDSEASARASLYASVYGHAIDGLLGHCGISRPPRGIVMKDPIGFYASPWVARRYACRVVVTVRNPFSWVASMLKAKFSIDCGAAGLCSEDLLLERFLRENILQLQELAARPGATAAAVDDGLADAANEAGRIVAAAAASKEHIDALFAVYATFMATARFFRAQHPSWTFVRWEDLVVAPTREWERAVGLQALEAAEGQGRVALMEALVETTGGAGPGQSKFSTRRDPWGELFDWQGSLPMEAISAVIARLRKVAEPFYRESYWWELDVSGSGVDRGGGGGFPTGGQPLFQEVSAEAGLAAHPGPGMGFAWGDADGDGFLDLFLGYHFDAVYRPEAAEDLGRGNGGFERYPEPTLFFNDNLRSSAAAGRTFRARKISEFSNVPTERCRESPCLEMTIPADYHGASFVDFDGDGDEDLVVATGGGAGVGHSPHLALRNDGGGHFTYIEGAFGGGSGSGSDSGSGSASSVGGWGRFALSELQRGRFSHWGDWDGDGLLDLVISGDSRIEPPLLDTMVFLQRRGAAAAADSGSEGVFMMVNDNPMKMRIRSRIGPHAKHAGMLVIQGDKQLGRNLLVSSTSTIGGSGSGSAFRVTLPLVSIEDDPCIVLCFAWYSLHGKYCCVFASAFGPAATAPGGAEAEEQLNAILMGLKEAVNEARPSKLHLTSCALAEDFDNDGDVDLFVVFFHSIRGRGADAAADLAGTTVYFVNEGGESDAASNGYGRPVSFRRVERPVLFEGYARDVAHNPDCCAAVDYDNDGRMDVFMTTSPFLWYLHGIESFGDAKKNGTFDPKYWKFAAGPPVLLRNRQDAGHWLKIVPVGDGVSVPRQPIGTKVTISASGSSGGGYWTEQTQTLTDGVLVFAQGDRRLHFGLGKSALVESILVTWPDGHRDVLVPERERADCVVRVVRGAAGAAAELLYDEVI